MLMPSLYLSILVNANVDVNAVVVDVNDVNGFGVNEVVVNGADENDVTHPFFSLFMNEILVIFCPDI